MNNFVFFFSLLIVSAFSIFAQPKHEVRAVWIATNHQLDWPPKSTNPDIQKNALIKILDNLKSKNFNTIYFQVRSQGTVLYKSEIEPWSSYLTGKLGSSPSYDPLEFVLEEAHKRNFEVHAWINVLNIKSGDFPIPITNPIHITLVQPNWIKKYFDGTTNSYWLDPGFPEVREYIRNICIELVRNYDIDGIHLDYIRYPGKNFDDSLSYSLYGQGKSIEDFRTENITKLVSEIYDSLTIIKPSIKIGSAPIGIYENLSEARGWEGKNDVFQDSREWLKLGKQDYLTPQIYWDIESNPKFDILARDWIRNNFNRQIIIGLGAYNPSVQKQLEQQIQLTREFGANGQSFFRYEHIKNKWFNAYKFPAIIPPMKWKDSIPPEPPFLLSGRNYPDRLGLVELVWGIPGKAVDGDTAKYYLIYRNTDNQINREDPKHILSLTKNYYYYDFIRKPSQFEYFYQVTSLDKNFNESTSATEIIKVELTNLKNILTENYAKRISAISFSKDKINLLIEIPEKQFVNIKLMSKDDEVLSNVYEGEMKNGLNFIELKLPKIKEKKFVIKIMYSDLIERISFSL